jgi:hypothetical protein
VSRFTYAAEQRPAHTFRLEDYTKDGKYVIQAELPGEDPEKNHRGARLSPGMWPFPQGLAGREVAMLSIRESAEPSGITVN